MFHRICKHGEESRTYDGQRCIFDEIRGDGSLSGMFEISPESKLNSTTRWRNKIFKMLVNLEHISKYRRSYDLLCFDLMSY